jgi:5'-3' exonuclease
MGIKHFFTWFKQNFSKEIYNLKSNQNFSEINVEIDNLMIDMNGILHDSSQKIYKYGNYKLPPRLLKKNVKNNVVKQIKVFEDICKTLEKILKMVNPKKRLILCIDGPAPISKQNQQRQRRFRSALESSGNSFDSNCITPGTKFMHYLSKYIDWFIRKQITVNPNWKDIEIVFSNEKSPGEGEHKLINYIRNYANENESFCIHGLDADLIMLSLATHIKKFYIFREDLYDPNNDYFCINIGNVYVKLIEKHLFWESEEYNFNKKCAINDFIFLCFIVGNDFLPHIPSIEIIENGLELILDIYKEICTSYGHITYYNTQHNVKFSPNCMKIFLNTIGNCEKDNLENKLNKKQSFFKDIILNENSKQKDDGTWVVDIENYKKSYMKKSFEDNFDIEKICHKYLEGMQWVLSYYTKGVPNWKWYFDNHYAPPASVLSLYIDTFKFPIYRKTEPTTPFQQLMCVLPPKSANLIPHPLNNLLTEKNSPIKKFYPENFEIDLSGKRKEWEGIVLLPMVDVNIIKKYYSKHIDEVQKKDLNRNVIGYSFIYQKTNYNYTFKSFYGDIPNCNVKTNFIVI